MPDGVPVSAAVLALVAALVHIYIFVLESILWTTPRARASFGLASEQEAITTRELAYNQGWYNLFLAIGTVVGVLHSYWDRAQDAGRDPAQAHPGPAGSDQHA